MSRGEFSISTAVPAGILSTYYILDVLPQYLSSQRLRAAGLGSHRESRVDTCRSSNRCYGNQDQPVSSRSRRQAPCCIGNAMPILFRLPRGPVRGGAAVDGRAPRAQHVEARLGQGATGSSAGVRGAIGVRRGASNGGAILGVCAGRTLGVR